MVCGGPLDSGKDWPESDQRPTNYVVFHPASGGFYMMWRYDMGVTLAWNSNGASLGGGYTIQRKRSFDTTWLDLEQVPATETSYTDLSLSASTAATYRIVYFYGNKTSGPS